MAPGKCFRGAIVKFLSSPALLFLGLAIAAFLPEAPAVVRRDDTSDTLYRKLGNGAPFRSVGRVEIDYGDGFHAIGTATLFGRDRLVSAAHVFAADALEGAEGVRINFGPGRVQNIDFQGDGVINLNPRYNSHTLQNDVSVVFLPQKVSLNPGVFYVGKRLALDTPITFVGYGDTGTGLTGSTRYSIVKRGGQNALGRYIYQNGDFEVDFDRPGSAAENSLGSSRALALEGLLGPGDSGGSAWVKVGRKWRMVGINSYGLDSYPGGRGDGVEDDYGDRSGFVYLPKYVNWIDSVKNPNASGAGQKSLSPSAVPEPGPLALLAAAGVALLIFRRRLPA